MTAITAPKHNLYHLFHQAFAGALDRVAIETDDGQHWTFGNLHRQSAQMANWLQAQGLRPGDRAMVQVEKSVPALVFYLACLRAGVVYVPLNTAYQAGELAYFMENAEPRVFVADPARMSTGRCGPPESLQAPDSHRSCSRATVMPRVHQVHGSQHWPAPTTRPDGPLGS